MRGGAAGGSLAHRCSCGVWSRRRKPMHLATEQSRFDRQLLHAGEQHVIGPALTLEVVAAVLVHPAQQWHQHALLHEPDDRCSASAAVRPIPHFGGEPPGVGFTEQLGEYQPRCLGRACSSAQHPFDRCKERGIVERFGSCFDELAAESFAYAAVKLRHDRVDIDARGVTAQSLRPLLIARIRWRWRSRPLWSSASAGR